MESRSTAAAERDARSHCLPTRSSWGDWAGPITGTLLSPGSPQQAGIGRWDRLGFSGRCHGSSPLRALRPHRSLWPSPPAYGGSPHAHPPWPPWEQGGRRCPGCCTLWLRGLAEALWPCRFISWLLASLGMKIL